MRNHRARSMLALAALSALCGAPLYRNTPDDKGAAPPPEPKGKDKPADAPPQPGISEDELQRKIEAALVADRKKRDDADAKAKQDRDADEAKKRGEFEDLYKKETDARAKADERADEAERKVQLLEVGVQLRDYLAADTARAAYLSNAIDIMRGVEPALTADAKAEDVKKLIESETKAFIDRTGAKKPAVVGAPPAPPRTPLRGDNPGNNPNRPHAEQHAPSVASRTF